MEIDPDALGAAGALCERQERHARDMSSYLDGVLDRPEAFSGVLTLVAGSYAGAVAAGRRGLADAARAAGLMGRGMVRLRAEVLATDDEVARLLDRIRPEERYAAPPGGPAAGYDVAGPAGPLVAPGPDPAAVLGWGGGWGGGGEEGGSGASSEWEQRSDAAADRWRATWDGADGRDADPGRYDAERDARRGAWDVVDLALAPDRVVRSIQDSAGDLAVSLQGTADALGDVRAREDLLAGAGGTPSAGEVARDARGWWR